MVALDSTVPSLRVKSLNDQPVRRDGQFVLYWMIANRRPKSNYSLQRAADWAVSLGRPLLVLEALRTDYRWASDRMHRFVVQGMADNQRYFADSAVTYWPYVEPEQDAGNDFLAELARQAVVVVTDDFPCFFLPRMLTRVARQLDVKMEMVDSNGLLPMRAATQVFTLAHSFRRFLQRELPDHLAEFPESEPIASRKLISLDDMPKTIDRRWPATAVNVLADPTSLLAQLPIDHRVGTAAMVGGHIAAEARLASFLSTRLERYTEERNQPDLDAASGLSPYFHFGHLSAHQVFDAVMARDHWRPKNLSTKVTGSREGWWGAPSNTEAFLDELITWRELGYNMCWQSPNYNRYESLPDWAQATLREHRTDPRPAVYGLEQFEAAETHDPIWNAVQNQLRREGRVHNYLRMLWGKKILHWSESPQAALEIMIQLNNKYAVDGRNPNSYSGIFWTLGRYDRAWGPERPIFGKIRYMTSENTVRKIQMRDYLRTYSTSEV